MRSVTQLEWMEDAAKFRYNYDISEESWIRAMCLATGDVVLNGETKPITADQYDNAVLNGTTVGFDSIFLTDAALTPKANSLAPFFNFLG